jgi:uncharacterized membrane protein YvlD (DUF360 family)
MITLLHLAVLTGTILLLSRFFTGVRVENTPAALLTAVVFSLLNWALGWLLGMVASAILFIPAILTLGLLFMLVPFVVNTAVLWLTDKALHAFEISNLKTLLLSSGVITVVNAVFHFMARA